jgi:L-lactate dehydrogenase complex protein LldF
MSHQDKFISKDCQQAILPVFEEYLVKRKRALLDLGLNYEEYRQKIKEIKKSSIANSKALREKAIRAFKNNGIKVFWAKDAEEARKIIEDLLTDKKKIVKAKSNAFHEIANDDFLKEKDLVETDLGDFIVDLLESFSIHPVLPSLHISPKDISRAIQEKYGEEVSPSSKAIAAFVKKILREKIINAEAAITGANFITADGQIVLLENEGNISLLSRIPKTHIVIAGFEKIVSDASEAIELVRASAIWGTGQTFPSYVSLISGPSKSADIGNEMIIGAQGAEEVNLVLIDNGRKELISAGLEELLHCINCGACLNFCPVFHQMGTAYGDKYLGSRGIVFAAFSESAKKAKDSNCFACTLCSACHENCPVSIDLPKLMIKTRNYLVESQNGTKANQEMIERIKKHGNPFGEIKKGEIPDQLYCC